MKFFQYKLKLNSHSDNLDSDSKLVLKGQMVWGFSLCCYAINIFHLHKPFINFCIKKAYRIQNLAFWKAFVWEGEESPVKMMECTKDI